MEKPFVSDQQTDRTMLDAETTGHVLRAPARFVTAMALAVLVAAAAYRLYTPVCQSSDDVVMDMLARGVGVASVPTPYLLYMNILMGHVLTFLYERFPGLDWYRALLVCVHCAAAAATAYVGFSRRLNTPRVLLLVSYFVVFDLHEYVGLHSLTIAALAAQAAVLLWLDRAVRGKGMGVPRALILLLLIMSAALIRPAGLALIAVLAFPALALLMVQAWRVKHPARPARLGRFGRLAWPAVVGGALVASVAAIDHQSYAASVGWRAFPELDALRARFTNFWRGTYLPNAAAVYHTLGWSANDEVMLRSWFFADRVRYGPSSLRTALSAQRGTQASEAWYLFLDLVRVLYGRVPTRMMLAAACLALCFVARRRGALAMALATALAVPILAVTLVPFIVRIPPWIYAPACGFVAALPLALPTRPFDWRHWHRPLIWLQIGWPIAVLVLAGTSLRHLRLESASIRDAHDRLMQAVADLKPQPDQLYVVWDGAFPFELFLGDADFAAIRKFRVLALGITTQTPVNGARLMGFGIDDIYRALYERPNVFLIANPALCALYASYIREHYGKDVLWNCIFRAVLTSTGGYDPATRDFYRGAFTLSIYRFREAGTRPPSEWWRAK